MSTGAAARAWGESLAPVTAAMMDIARPAPGERALDVGAGNGQLAFEIAARVGPSGEVLAIDPSPEAIAVIQHHAGAARDGAPVRALVASAESLDAGTARFDLAVARNSVMYFDDLARGLANVRRALRPGGRFVASVYAPLDEEPFHAIPLAAVTRRCALEPPLPEYAAAFELDVESFGAALRASGFRVASASDVAIRRTFESRELLRGALHCSGSLAALLSRLPALELESAWQEIDAGFDRYVGESGVVIPGRQWVVAAAC